MPRLLRGAWGEILLVAVILAGLSLQGRCATSSKHSNSLGVVQYLDNPFTYKMGAVIGAEVVRSKTTYATSIAISPSYTYSFFREDLLFCGNESEMFTDPETGRVWRGPLVITYRTRATRLVDGVACHVLEGVERVKERTVE